MTKSTFYHDGYRDAQRGLDPCAPDEFSTSVYAVEYKQGYQDGMDAKDKRDHYRQDCPTPR
jgi:hypothetical protein